MFIVSYISELAIYSIKFYGHKKKLVHTHYCIMYKNSNTL